VLGVYLAALIFGGGMLLLSVMGGHESAHGGGGHDAAGHAGGGHIGGQSGHGLHAGGGHAHGVGHAAHGAGQAAQKAATAAGGSDLLAIFLSLRFWTFFLACGGLSGVLLTLVGVPEGPAAAMAASSGLVLGTFSAWALLRLSRAQLSSALGAEDWIGRNGRVTVPVSAARAGKVRLEFDGEVVDFIATAAESEGELGVGTEVIVVELVDGVVKVTPSHPDRKALSANESKLLPPPKQGIS
jgi:membrane protein implicated in regulation of membrane protease activity